MIKVRFSMSLQVIRDRICPMDKNKLYILMIWIIYGKRKVRIAPIAHNDLVGEVAAREPALTGHGVTEMEHQSSSSPLSHSPALKVRYSFPVG